MTNQTLIDAVVSEMFRHLVSGPIQTPEQAGMWASEIAGIICDSASKILASNSPTRAEDALALHQTYSEVRKNYSVLLGR